MTMETYIHSSYCHSKGTYIHTLYHLLILLLWLNVTYLFLLCLKYANTSDIHVLRRNTVATDQFIFDVTGANCSYL